MAHHVRQNVVAYLALFVSLGGTGAYAANTIRTGDIVDNEVFTTDVRDDTLGFGGLYHQDLGAGSVRGSEVLNSSLTGLDITDGTLTGGDILESTLVGVKDGDSCGNSGAALFGRLCAGSDGVDRDWTAAADCCASLPGGTRLPTWGEALLLGRNHDVPGVGGAGVFWTDEIIQPGTGSLTGTNFMVTVDENGNGSPTNTSATAIATVCVTTPD